MDFYLLMITGTKKLRKLFLEKIGKLNAKKANKKAYSQTPLSRRRWLRQLNGGFVKKYFYEKIDCLFF